MPYVIPIPGKRCLPRGRILVLPLLRSWFISRVLPDESMVFIFIAQREPSVCATILPQVIAAFYDAIAKQNFTLRQPCRSFKAMPVHHAETVFPPMRAPEKGVGGRFQ